MNSRRAEVSVTYSIEQASWILGVPRSVVARGVRQGWIRTLHRRGRIAIPAFVVIRLLGREPSVGGDAR
jgi:hypothetical protein